MTDDGRDQRRTWPSVVENPAAGSGFGGGEKGEGRRGKWWAGTDRLAVPHNPVWLIKTPSNNQVLYAVYSLGFTMEMSTTLAERGEELAG